MRTLEIEPLTDKRLNVIIVEKEYDEPIIQDENSNGRSRSKSLLELIKKPSMAFSEFLWEICTMHKPDFITEELGIRQREDLEENAISNLARKLGIPYRLTDIDEYAKAYLMQTLDEKREMRDKVLKELAQLSKRKSDFQNNRIEYLIAYGQYLQYEFEEEMKKISCSIRESWIVMGILDQAKEVKRDKMISVHVCSPSHVEGIAKLLKSLNVEVLHVKIEKKVTSEPAKSEGTAAESQGKSKNLEPLEFQLVPVIKDNAKKALPYILFFLDTDKHASAFEICIAYDAGFDKVVPYETVTPEDAQRICQDAIFSRGPKGIKHSCFFIGGSDLKKAEEINKIVTSTMTPPFEAPIIIDPHGAYTTAASIIAKAEQGLSRIGINNLKDKVAVVLAGTGPVGRTSAMLCAQLGFKVYITSRTEEKAKAIAEEISPKTKVKIEGIQAATQEEIYQAIKDAALVICTGSPGTEIISRDTLTKLKGRKVIVDANAVPPLGVSELRPKDDLKEIASGIYGIGALVVGNLKYRLEREILTDAQREGKGVFDYNYALDRAKKLLEETKAESPLVSAEEIRKIPPIFMNP